MSNILSLNSTQRLSIIAYYERKHAMKQIIPLLIIIFILPISVKAKSLTYIKIGANFSSFRKEEGRNEPGLCFGAGKEFYPIRSFNGFFDLGIDFKRKKYILENRTWQSDPYYNISDIEMGDINVNILYAELPINVGYSIVINNQFVSNIYTGYSLSIPIKNHTKISDKKTIPLGPDERKTYNFDYIPLDENYTIPSTNFILGARLSFKRLAIITSYARALSVTEGVTSLSVRDKIDTFEISMAFLF